MNQHTPSLFSLAGMALALLLSTACYGPKDMNVKGPNGSKYNAEDGNIAFAPKKMSLFERCLERQRGRSEDAAIAHCEAMMRNMESNPALTYTPVIGTAPIHY
jgi:hypothetical protein